MIVAPFGSMVFNGFLGDLEMIPILKKKNKMKIPIEKLEKKKPIKSFITRNIAMI